MVSFALNTLALSICAVSLLFSPTESARVFDRRTDLANTPPVSESGYTLPLEGGEICVGSANCINSLPSPAINKTLYLLAIGRGIFNYTCADARPDSLPLFVSQYTELYNAAALIPLLPNEASFHALTPRFYDFDYAEGKNSTLECIGGIGTLDDVAVITLYDADTFEAYLQNTVKAPTNPQLNGLWAHSRSADGDWEVYRVEMAGGAIPATCQDQPVTFEVRYAAEYWFYGD